MDDDERSNEDSVSDDEETHSQLDLSDPLSRNEKRVKKETPVNGNMLATSGLNDFASLTHHSLGGHLSLSFSQSSLLNNAALSSPAHHPVAHHAPHLNPHHPHSAHHPHHTSPHSLVNNMSPLSSSNATSNPVGSVSPLHHPHLHHPHAHPPSNPLSHLHHALPLTAHSHPAFLASLHRH